MSAGKATRARKAGRKRTGWMLLLIGLVAVGVHYGLDEWRSRTTSRLAKKLGSSEIGLSQLKRACQAFRDERGEWPRALSDLPDPKKVVGTEVIHDDAWIDPLNGIPYILRPKAAGGVEIGSWGSDGVEGGDGFAMDRLRSVP